MFSEIPSDKIRKGLIGLRRFYDEYVPTLSFDVKCVSLMEDDEMVGVVVYGNGRIYSLAVSEAHRGCGYGHSLFEYVVNDSADKNVTVYVPVSYHKAVASFINWGCYFEGFFTSMGSPTRYYRLNYNPNRKEEDVGFYDEKLWEDSVTMADEAVVLFNVGQIA